jgi:hypothetical protein
MKLPRLRREGRPRRSGWASVVVCLGILGFGSTAAAQAPAASAQAPAAPTGRDDFEVGVFTGFSIDSFAAKELRKYLNKSDSGGVSEQLILGLDFAYRLAGDRDSQQQVWLYGESVHGARSGDVDCKDEDNQETELCKVARFESPTPDAQFAIFRKATTLEGFMGVRAELFNLRQRSTAPSRFYLKGQLGFLTTADNGGDIIDLHHMAAGLMLTGGTFEGSYFEAGYGRNDLFQQHRWRAKIDGFLSIAPQGMDSRARPFVQIVIDPDFGSAPDSIQIFAGLDIDILEIFK